MRQRPNDQLAHPVVASPWAGPGWRYGLANLAAGMDEMAERAGHPDGFHLAVKELGADPGQVSGASKEQAWEWFMAAYARWGDRGCSAGDAVSVSVGIAGTCGSGWGDAWHGGTGGPVSAM